MSLVVHNLILSSHGLLYIQPCSSESLVSILQAIALLREQQISLDVLLILFAAEEAGHKKSGQQIKLMLEYLNDVLRINLSENKWWAHL